MLREAGFTQRHPQKPGIYFLHEPRELAAFANPFRLAQGWDVCSISWKVHKVADTYDGHTPEGHWSIHTLSGMNQGWQKGMWIKGPIEPFQG